MKLNGGPSGEALANQESKEAIAYSSFEEFLDKEDLHPLFIETYGRDWPEYKAEYASKMPELMIHVSNDMGYELDLVDEQWDRGEFISAQVKAKKVRDLKKIVFGK